MTSMLTTGFTERWRVLARERSPLCLGVAPSDKWLENWNLPPGVEGARRYARIVVAAATDVAAVKVQTPFFTRFGEAGTRLLRDVVDGVHGAGALAVLDAKIGDADDTMPAYAETYLGSGSVYGGDALVANAYLGFGSLHPLLRHAADTGCAVFVLVRTSNHAAGGIQRARDDLGRTVAEALADEVTAYNAGTAGAAAAVVGARRPESDALLARLPGVVVEVPGLGRADRDSVEVIAPARPAGDLAMFTVTTGVLREGPDPSALRAALARWRDTVHTGH